MAGRTMAVDPLTSWRSAAQASQIGLGSRFIEKDQPCRVEALLPPLPGFACARQIGALLFAGSECLFLYVSAIFASTTWMACKEHLRPMASRSSFKVRSFFLAKRARIWLWWLATTIGFRPAK